jgi:DNA-3-methyladenine glycosylase I
MKARCAWSESDILKEYHDKEWGVPVHDDKKLFEFLILEGAQAGLSWLTILKRRKGYKKAFANFSPQKVVKFTKRDVNRLLKDEGIIRNRLKIEAAINNAQQFLKVQKEFGSFDKYIWSFVDYKPINNAFKKMSDIPATTPLSDKISKDMKARGFKFVGPTIIYAHMQATGMVNDHVTSCFRYNQV